MRHRPLVLTDEQPGTLGGNPLSAVCLHYLLCPFPDPYLLSSTSEDSSYAGNFASLGGIQRQTAGNEPSYEAITGLPHPSNRLCPTVDSHRFGRLRVYCDINKDRNFLVALYGLPRAPRFFTVAL